MQSYILVLWTLLTLAVASAVLELKVDTFDQFVTENDLALVAFIAPWCQYCQELEPEYEAAAKILLTRGVPVARVDCAAQETLCLDQGIPIYPSIFSFQNGKRVYNGRRNTDAIVAFVERLLKPSVTFLDHAREVTDFKAKDNVTIIGYFDESDEESKALFIEIAKSYHGRHSFASIVDESFGNFENVQKPAIVLYKPFDYGRSLYTDSFEGSKVIEFLEDASVPLIREVGVDVDSLRPGHPLPYALIFSKPDEQRKAFLDGFLPLVQKTDDDVAWFVVDPTKYPEYLDRVGLKSRTIWPAFGIEDAKNEFNFALSIEDDSNKITPQVLEGFLQEFLAGQLQKTERERTSLEGHFSFISNSSHDEL